MKKVIKSLVLLIMMVILVFTYGKTYSESFGVANKYLQLHGINSNTGGSGGSGYIGNANLTNKVMYCNGCGNNSSTNTKTVSGSCASGSATADCSKSGNGYARVSFVRIE